MSTSNGMGSDPRRGRQPWPYSTEVPATTETHRAGREPNSEHGGHGGHAGHGLMMIACCIPMLAIAGLLVLTGVAGSGLILTALVCTAMMAAMMFAMPGGNDGHGHKGTSAEPRLGRGR